MSAVDRERGGLARKWVARGAFVAALAGIGATQTGCIEIALLVALVNADDDPDYDYYDDDWQDDQPPQVDPVPPLVTVEIADWPPIGPSGAVTVNAWAENGIAQADLEFHNITTLWGTGGTAETFFATGSQLGEGFGDLTVTVSGNDGAFTTAYVTDLVVDLTPPQIVLGPTTLPAQNASFDFWMGDAWVLSKAELSFGGTVLTEELPIGYPSTLGVAWDYSLVRFDVSELPAITDIATITVTDAAGNVTVQELTLSIDGAPPVASFLSPDAGDEVSGTFEVEVEAYDAQPGPLVIDLFAGGTIVATGNGPTCTFVLSADELPEGPIALEAVATDEAGNRSVPARVSLVVDREDEPPPPEE